MSRNFVGTVLPACTSVGFLELAAGFTHALFTEELAEGFPFPEFPFESATAVGATPKLPIKRPVRSTFTLNPVFILFPLKFGMTVAKTILKF